MHTYVDIARRERERERARYKNIYVTIIMIIDEKHMYISYHINGCYGTIMIKKD